MYSSFSWIVGALALASVGLAEPIPAKALITCPVHTATVTATCTGIYNCPLKKLCTQTVTTTTPCGGPGPACQPPPTPTVTSTVDKGCTAPCGGTCAYTSTATVCHPF